MKKTLLFIGLVTILAGCTQFNVTPATSISHEYGEDLDKALLFDKEASSEGTKVKEVKGFNALKVGSQEITVIFNDADEKKELEAKVKVEVKDTKLPTIVLAKDKVKITEGDELDLKAMVQEVKDAVDGSLTYVEKDAKNGNWSFHKGKLNTSKAGTYEVIVVAIDKNGNRSETVIEVNVKEKPVEKEEPKVEKETQQSTYQEPIEQPIIENQHVCKATTLGNSGLLFSTEGEANSYGEGLINQGTATSYTATAVFCKCNTFVGYTIDYVYEVAQQPAETPKEEDNKHTCKADGQWTTLGNSGVAFYDYEEAYNFSLEHAPENHGAAITDTYDVCGNEAWTIEWFELRE